MGYGLGSSNSEEVDLYNQIKEKIKDGKKNGYVGIARED